MFPWDPSHVELTAPCPERLLEAEEAKGSCRHGEGKELLEPRSLDAQGHGQCHQEQGAVGLTPEQHPGLWDQLQLGAHASF